ncbi:protein PTHB1 isoform X1 [Diabrotica virgifera virgifera]|uniref:Protein PTHB1 isoform X2 n=1 Tax=Diabrotica virgifera virgifera TaxID=50390 RepID=A0A6P7F8Z9_DIAVI|nr:protein PTHB1 isoform X1 [Diabrotica virgifera virgifera]
MSLFKTRSFWATQSEDDEYFDQNSMIITQLNGDSDYIITGSQSGVLRILKPSCTVTDNELSGFAPNDLVIEKIFDQPILQVGYGRLVSGSQNYQTAVLSPRRLSVHLLKIKEGQTEHGTQNTFETLYEHHLLRSAANFTIGPFGGSQNRDFICVQSLDGMLSFFEQENQTFCCFLPDFLLPSPMVYVKKTDTFLTLDGSWNIVCYRYNSLSEVGERTENDPHASSKIAPLWSYFLGEPVIDINTVEDEFNKISYILILGERNYFCIYETGRLTFMKKLEYSPICFEVYMIKEKVFSLIVSETSDLLVYENTKLKWSAKLQFLPVCLKRAFLKHVKGSLVLLSEEGRLECCYLGTEPSLFVAPPLAERELDLEKVEDELKTLNERIRESYGNDLKFANQNPEKEITIKIQVSKDLVPCVYETNLKDPKDLQMCPIKVEVTPQMAFDEIQISVSASKPIKITPDIDFHLHPEDTMDFECFAFLYEDLEVPSLTVNVSVTVISSLGIARSFNKSAMLPIKLIAESSTPQKDGNHKITLSVTQNVVPLLTLFPEFGEETKTSNAIAFKNFYDSGQPVTVLLAKSSDRYRIQSSSIASLSCIIEQIIFRLNNHYRNVDEFKVVYSSALPSTEVVLYVKEHFSSRQEVSKLETSLQQLGQQFIIIQKRLISKFKVKNPTPLTNLEVLMKDTYNEIDNTIQMLNKANKKLTKAQVELSCVLNLIENLIKIMDIDNKMKEEIVSIFCPSVDDIESQDWEDVMDAALSYLLRTSLAKSEKDKLRISQSNVEKVTDISKMEKRLVQVLERISKIETPETVQVENENEEEEEELSKPEIEHEDEKPMGSQLGQASMRLLSARRSLLRKRHKNEEE